MNEVRIRGNGYPLVRNIGYTLARKGWIHPDRLTDYHVFIYVLQGRMQVIEDGQEYILQEGDVFFLKRGIRHWGGAGTLPGTLTFWIHFYDTIPAQDDGETKKGDLGDWVPSPSYQVFLPGHYDLTLELPKLAQIHNIPFMNRKIKELYEMYTSSRYYHHFQVSLGAMDIFLDVLRASMNTRSAGGKTDALVQKLIRYLEKHCAEELATEQIAERFRMNYHYISTIFRNRVGTSIFKYHEKLRIYHAAELLKNTSLNVSEVSDKIGFKCPYYFSRVFKKLMGESPSVYIRNVYRNESNLQIIRKKG
ncbi:MAG: transcriptional regulator, AraC family [Paenibacillaceae bacterium]|jgi:AraC-like DNA-binding protein|nr:transcriptional regulator, AraC family [Paenibacillaceae bacterium]